LDRWQANQAFVSFNESAPCPEENETTLLVSSKKHPEFKAQLVFDDLSTITREWSLRYHEASIRALRLCAVTGTNGKSSVVHFFEKLMFAHPNCGPIAKLGTLGFETKSGHYSSPNTTPFPLDLHPMLEQACREGQKMLVLEASSHALDQDRLKGLDFEVVAFTNLTQDHLDYHETMEHLFKSKIKLLDLCRGKAWVNLDCDFFSALRNRPNVMTYSCIDSKADLYANILERDDGGFKLKLFFKGQCHDLSLPLLGEFNVSNALCALGMALSIDEASLELYLNAMSQLSAPKGRLQKVICRARGKVMIDYAHTPNALESVLKAMHHHIDASKLKLLFGCGGNRDKSKRAIMGNIASRLVQTIYLTSDNPRFEDPQAIIEEVASGIDASKVKLKKIISREQAIAIALSELQEDELLLLCGKGHESTQEIQGRKLPMSEEELCLKI